MKLQYKSWWYKLISVGRYLMARIYYGSRFQSQTLSMIGERCGIHIFKGGQIICAGRIILDDHVMLYAKGTIRIGKQFSVNRYSRLVAHEQIEVGNYVTIGQSVAILDHDHDYSLEDGQLRLDGYQTAPITIGNNVWLADKCTVLKGVRIGDNVIAGANTLINKDVPSNSVIGGVPFRIIRKLD